MIISFNKNLYPLKAIKSSIEAYDGLAKFKLSKQKGYYITEVSDIDKDVKNVLKDEFCNYIISEIKQ